MGYDAPAGPERGWRLWLAAAWIFGAAAYYYIRFTIAFVHENETVLRRAFPRAADTFLSQPSRR